MSYTDTGLTIIDNNTQLEWAKLDDNNLGCGSYPGNLDKDCGFNWDEAFAFVASLIANNHAGYSDWRVPNVKELQSIVNYEFSYPAIFDQFDANCEPGCTVNVCSCNSTGNYWSSTSFLSGPSMAWIVSFMHGDLGLNTKSVGEFVRAVRGM